MARIYREGQNKTCFIYRCFTSGKIVIRIQTLSQSIDIMHFWPGCFPSLGTLEEVILQRQIQKGSLATMTMDRSQKSNDTADRLNANELRDCFTLKDERCVCDTRRKVGTWPDYGEFYAMIKLLKHIACISNQYNFNSISSRWGSEFGFTRMSR